MRSLVRVGVPGGCAGVLGLLAVTWCSRAPHTTDVAAKARASLERGTRLWHASCPVPEIDGACVELGAAAESRPDALPTRCGPASRHPRIAVRRDAGTKAAALAAFADVAALATGRPDLGYELGLANVYAADAAREAAIAMPAPLPEQLGDWLKVRIAARELAAARYATVVVAGEPKTVVIASARIAQVDEDLANELLASEIPSAVRTGELAADRIDAYCDALTAAAEPALERATRKYAACFAQAMQLDWFSEWSTLCEIALEQLDPERYPALNELPAAAGDRHIGAGFSTLQHREYAAAKQLFADALALAPRNYDALVGLGIAQRGLGDFDAAEASYNRARKFDPARGDAYYDLAILAKDFRANAASDLRGSRDMYVRARSLFGEFIARTERSSDRANAEAAIADCDKAIKQIETYLADAP